VNTSKKYTTYILKGAATLALLVVAVWALHLGWNAYRVYTLAQEMQSLTQAGDMDIQRLQATLARLNHHFKAVDADLQPIYPLLEATSGLPGVGGYAGQVQPLVQYARSLSQAGELMVNGLAPFWQQDDPAWSARPSSERLFLVLQSGGADFELAVQAIERARRMRSQIRPELLPERLRSIITKADQSFPLIQAGAGFFTLAPELMGASQSARYLVLAQNRHELRATGGFISGIGTIELQRGQVAGFNVGDSYTVDDFSKPYPLPPEPLQRLMLAGYWVARDANWSPDFPSAAQQTQALYQLTTGVETQGVIAFDQLGLSGLLSALGPISLPDAPEAVTAENVEDFMQQSWQPEPGTAATADWWVGRKDFMGTLGKAMLDRLFALQEPGILLNLGETALELIKSGHILVYLNQAEAQAVLEKAGLAHQIAPPEGDFLMLVDANLGFNKADALMERSILYQVDLSDPAHPEARLSVQYAHQGQGQAACVHEATYGTGAYDDLQQRCYWDYWRVYVPSGSLLRNAQVKPVPAEELLSKQAWPGVVESYPGEAGTQVFAGVLVIPVGGRDSIMLEYSLPPGVLGGQAGGGWRYSLHINKQPGIEQLPIVVQVLLPAQTTILLPPFGWEQASPGTWVWSAHLEKDHAIELDITSASQGEQ
jgi:hypothetical protein